MLSHTLKQVMHRIRNEFTHIPPEVGRPLAQ
jgi:hypothetical protein